MITKNNVAIRLYERLGFRAIHTWRSFIGSLGTHAATDPLVPMALDDAELGPDIHYSWDFHMRSLLRAPQRWQLLARNGDLSAGYVVLDPSTGRIARAGVADEHDASQWQQLLGALAAVRTEVRFINVHPERSALIEALLSCGLPNVIDQYGMRKTL